MSRIGLRGLAVRLRGDERGVSVIELGIVSPFLFFLIMGMTDIARGYAAKLNLEQAAHRALEQVAVGTVQGDYSYLQAEAAAAAGVPEANVTVATWLECDQVAQPAFDGVCPDGQMVSHYVRVTVTSTFRPSFNYSTLGRNFLNTASNGTITQTGSAALRVQ
jgi:Flp pilus assembly protein TadG